MNCNHTNYYAKPSGRRIGVYCTDCNTWICWTTYSKMCELYEHKENELIDDSTAYKRISKSKNRVITMQCSKCDCPLYDSSKPRIQYRFDLVNANFCPKCGRRFTL